MDLYPLFNSLRIAALSTGIIFFVGIAAAWWVAKLPRLAKGVLDAIIICVMAASQGKGSIFSAVPVWLFQGAVTAIAFFAGPFFPQAALERLSFVGSILIFCVGLNLLRRTQIRVANLLPALVFAAALPL